MNPSLRNVLQGQPKCKQSATAICGNGISFDPGGNPIRVDMGGTTICSAIVTATKLSLPINIVGLALFVKISPDISPTSQEMSLGPRIGAHTS